MSEPEKHADFILGLLRQFNCEKEQFPSYVGDDHPRSPETVKIIESLDEVDIRSPQFVQDAQRWWANHRTVSSRQTKFRRLRYLLKKLDKYYSRMPLLLLDGTEGKILVGQRWWNALGRCLSPDGGPLDGPPHNVWEPFSHLRAIPTQHVAWHSGKSSNRIFRPESVGTRLRVGLCPLTGHSHTEFEATSVVLQEEQAMGFTASSIRNNEPRDLPTAERRKPRNSYCSELRNAVRWARKQRIQVLCFPELSVCPEGREAIREEITRDSHNMSLVIPGSFHETAGTQSVRNIARVWIPQSTEIDEISRSQKIQLYNIPIDHARGIESLRQPVEEAEKQGCLFLREHIDPGSKMHFIETTLGIIAVLICKDAIIDSPWLTSCLRLADTLLIISMNPSTTDQFVSVANEAAKYGIATFYVNASQAISESDWHRNEAAFIKLPFRLKDRPSLRRYLLKVPESERDNPRFCPVPENGRIEFSLEVPPETLYA